jgi:hypothetical protein
MTNKVTLMTRVGLALLAIVFWLLPYFSSTARLINMIMPSDQWIRLGVLVVVSYVVIVIVVRRAFDA